MVGRRSGRGQGLRRREEAGPAAEALPPLPPPSPVVRVMWLPVCGVKVTYAPWAGADTVGAAKADETLMALGGLPHPRLMLLMGREGLTGRGRGVGWESGRGKNYCSKLDMI